VNQLALPVLDTDALRSMVTKFAVATEAALANGDVRSLIATGRFAWSEDAVRRSPTVRAVFELGEVRGGLAELQGLINYAAKRRLGAYVGFAPLRQHDAVSPVFLTVLFSREHPRRRRYEARAALREKLGRESRCVTMAVRLGTQKRFVEWVREQRGLSTTIRRRTGLTVKELWRRAKARAA
jgi:hypothetical protein